MKVSCIIPAYNESKTIAGVIETAVAARKAGLVNEIIVVSDGSTDPTAAIAVSSGADRVVNLRKNIGKTRAIFAGLAYASGETILFLDGDLLGLQPDHIEAILKPLADGGTDMAIGYLADDVWQNVIPYLSGQRAVRKSLLGRIPLRRVMKDRHCFEILLNRSVNRAGLKTLFVPLAGLSHVHKRQKYGLKKSLSQKVGFSANLAYMYRRALAGGAVVLGSLFLWNVFLKPPAVHGLALNKMPGPSAADSVLVIAAHPDDEIIGAGGYIYEAIKSGAKVGTVIMTNGDSNKWSAAIEARGLPSDEDFVSEGRERMQESRRAGANLGVMPDGLIFLGFPDRNLKALLDENWSTPITSQYTKWSENRYPETYRTGIAYTGENAASALREIIEAAKPSIIITHDPSDHNDDHASTYYFVESALAKLKDENLSVPHVYTFLVHWNIESYPKPLALRWNEGLYPPAQLQNACEWYAFPLSKDDELLKYGAVKKFSSQLESPYLYFLLRAFVRTNELFCNRTNN